MRLYMVRRTRSFIKNNYAFTDKSNNRKYLEFSNGKKSYFPDRIPQKVLFSLSAKDKDDQYAKLYADDVVDIIDELLFLDYYTMEADDDKFDSEEVIKLLKRLNKLETQTDTKLETEEALRDFWEYVEGREWEEQIISGNDHKNENL